MAVQDRVGGNTIGPASIDGNALEFLPRVSIRVGPGLVPLANIQTGQGLDVAIGAPLPVRDRIDPDNVPQLTNPSNLQILVERPVHRQKVGIARGLVRGKAPGRVILKVSRKQ